MKSKKFYFLFSGFWFLIFILFSAFYILHSVDPVFAQTQISTQIPGTGTGVTGAINNFYRYSLWLGGILAFGAVVYGGVKYIFAAGNPSGQSEGKDWIKSALLGLLLLAGAYLILNVINPNLTQLNFPTLAPQTVQGTAATTNSGTTYGCVADNNVIACSSSNSSSCSDVPACAGKTCSSFATVQCGTSVGGFTCKDGPCTPLSVANIPYTSRACSNYPNCSADSAMIPLLLCIEQKTGGIMTVTEAMLPTVLHISACHDNGCCVDTKVASFTSCSQVDAIISAARQCGAIRIANEYSNCGGTTYDTTTGNNIHIQGC